MEYYFALLSRSCEKCLCCWEKSSNLPKTLASKLWWLSCYSRKNKNWNFHNFYMEVQNIPYWFLNLRHLYRHIDCKKVWVVFLDNFRTELSILAHFVIKGARIAKRTRYPILAGFLGRVWIAATTRMQTFIFQKGRTEARKSGQKSLQKHFAMYVLFLFFKRRKSLFSSSLNLLKLFHCSAQVFF